MSHTILVVEDAPATLTALTEILEYGGYQVLTATNGLEGLAQLSSRRPDLILSDINMPQMDGYDLCQTVRANPDWVTIPFIFLTALDDAETIRRGKRLGVDDYLTKPIMAQDLLVAVEARLKRSAELTRATEARMEDLRVTLLRTLQHEFRTPLTHITGFTELLMDSRVEVGPEEFQQFMAAIRSGADRLSRLVDDFLLLAALQTGQAGHVLPGELEAVPLGPLVEQVVAQMAGQAAARQVILRSRVADGLPPVHFRPDSLADVLRRLLDNAIKFSKPAGGEVWIAASVGQRRLPSGKSVLMHVADNGLGIPADELPRLFVPFQQVNRDKLEQQGVGVGLALVRGLVELHGGQVTVESHLGIGTVFNLWLPVAP